MKTSNLPRTRLAASLFAVFAVPAVCVQTSAAQTTPVQSTQPILITASATEQTVANALASTTVLTREQIERSGAIDLPNLLKQVAGIQITQAGGVGKQTGVRLRGSQPNQALIMVDGVALNNNNFGSASIEHILAAQIERIEIVRGNVSALYGSHAVGGVIQIFTRGDAKSAAKNSPTFNVQAQAGSYGTANISAAANGNLGTDTFIAGSVSSYKTQGFSAINTALLPDANPDKDGYSNQSVSLRLQHRFNADQQLELSASTQNGKSDYDNAYGAPTDTHRVVTKLNTAQLQWRAKWLPAWQSNLRVGTSSEDARGTSNDPFSVYNYRSSNQTLAWEHQIELSDQVKATAAWQHDTQRLTADVNYPVQTRRVNALRAGLLGQSDQLDWQLNLRQDKYSDFGTASTYLLGAGYKLTPAWRVSVLNSSAFNAPTFNDLYYPGFSNPNLKPERNRSNELAAAYNAQGQTVRLTWFDTRSRDRIGYDPSTFKPINIARARNRGVELQYATQWDGYDITANLTAQNARNEITGARLPRQSRHLANLQVARSVGDFDWLATLHVTGNTLDSGRVLSGHALLDVRARYRLNQNLSVFAQINNLTNQTTQDIYGYNNPKRALMFGLNYSLR